MFSFYCWTRSNRSTRPFHFEPGGLIEGENCLVKRSFLSGRKRVPKTRFRYVAAIPTTFARVSLFLSSTRRNDVRVELCIKQQTEKICMEESRQETEDVGEPATDTAFHDVSFKSLKEIPLALKRDTRRDASSISVVLLGALNGEELRPCLADERRVSSTWARTHREERVSPGKSLQSPSVLEPRHFSAPPQGSLLDVCCFVC